MIMEKPFQYAKEGLYIKEGNNLQLYHLIISGLIKVTN
jgi:hypothetical protein